jgi:dephospho-CoA kinase
VLRVGVLGAGASDAIARLNALDVDRSVLVEDLSGSRARGPSYLLVMGIGARDESSQTDVDVWLDDPESVDDLWRDRLVPFAANLAAGRRAPRQRQPKICEPDPTWPHQARRLIARVTDAVGDEVIRVDHIGSTSVPGLPAKDLVDLQVVVTDLEVAAHVADGAHAAGFVRVRAPLFGTDRAGHDHPEVVVVDADPGRPVNVNIRPVGAPIWRETLLLRDWLRAQPQAAAEYATVKRTLAARSDHDVDDYGVDKMPWISAALGRAAGWAAESGWNPRPA